MSLARGRTDLLGLATRAIRAQIAAPIDGAGLGHLLIVRLSSLGDVVHSMPAVTAIHRAFPRLRITWAIEPTLAPLLEGHPAVDRVVAVPWPGTHGFAAAVRELRAEPYDLAIDLQGLLRSTLVTVLARPARRFVIAAAREGAHLFAPTLPAAPPGSHAIDEALSAAKALGAATGPLDFGLVPQTHATQSVNERLARGADPRPIATFAASSADPRKNWPAARWSELASRLGQAMRIVLVGDRRNRRAHAAIATAASAPVEDWTGTTTLPELVALLDRAAVVVAPDTGPAHLAAALGRPVVALTIGASIPRTTPFGPRVRLIDRRELCGASCLERCRSEPHCLREIRADEVARAATAGAEFGRSQREREGA